jgi:rSAM/selenodomain-associated transferase 2/rSAM/selenodomain-associated transferase 1
LAQVRELAEMRGLQIEVQFEGGSQEKMQAWLGEKIIYTRQFGADLGRRMQNAFEAAFGSGVERVVLIGSDIPEITAKTIDTAFEKLLNTDLVFGPAKDGGYYLIGIRATAFSRARQSLFHNIDWGAPSVMRRTRSIVEKMNLSYRLLEKLHDVDRPEDYSIWRNVCRSTTVSDRSKLMISVIIPALNEAETISATLSGLKAGDNLEIIVVDGGSSDATVQKARSSGAKTLVMPSPSKARQMNAGAENAGGDIYIFLHADTQLPENFINLILNAIRDRTVSAGAFRLRIDSEIRGMRFIEHIANLRSRYLQMPYGDQAIFISKKLFTEIGGFPDIPIMEDFEFIRQLRRKCKIALMPAYVLTSPRRWLSFGLVKTWLINQLIIAAYCMGMSPHRLARWYDRERGKNRRRQFSGKKIHEKPCLTDKKEYRHVKIHHQRGK